MRQEWFRVALFTNWLLGLFDRVLILAKEAVLKKSKHTTSNDGGEDDKN